MATQCALRLVGEEIIKQLQVDAEYKTAFACESDKRKQKFLTECMFKDDRCIFNDICTMGGCTAVCGIHSRSMLGDEQSECPIEVDKDALTICVCGMSCKDLSKMNMKFLNKANVLSGGGGSTQKTFNGLLEFLGAHHPTVWIGENVDDLSKLQSDNRAFMLNELKRVDTWARLPSWTRPSLGQRQRGSERGSSRCIATSCTLTLARRGAS